MPIDPRDKLDLQGRTGANEPNTSPQPRAKSTSEGKPEERKRSFLSVHFRCCNTYGRLYVNREGSHYAGRCPKCGVRTSARIGRGGTDQRIFEAG